MNEQQIITDTQWGERCSVKLDKLLFSTLQKLQIPTIIFINKIDRAGVNLERLHQYSTSFWLRIKYCYLKSHFS